MKEQEDYIRDIEEVRSMMERSSKFLSLSGLAGIMAGIYALGGAYVAWKYYGFNPQEIISNTIKGGSLPAGLLGVISLAIIVLVLAIGTAVFLSFQKASKKGEKFWNPTTERVLINLTIPLIAGGIFTLILISQGLIGLVAPSTLIFYGLAQFNASQFTYGEMRSLGLVHIVLGLIGSYFVEYGLLCWAIGFGLVHIIYGIYIHFRYER